MGGGEGGTRKEANDGDSTEGNCLSFMDPLAQSVAFISRTG